MTSNECLWSVARSSQDHFVANWLSPTPNGVTFAGRVGGIHYQLRDLLWVADH